MGTVQQGGWVPSFQGVCAVLLGTYSGALANILQAWPMLLTCICTLIYTS